MAPSEHNSSGMKRFFFLKSFEESFKNIQKYPKILKIFIKHSKILKISKKIKNIQKR